MHFKTYRFPTWACLQIKAIMPSVGMGAMQPLADKILEHMGTMYTTLGKPAEGLLYYLRSIQIQEELVGNYPYHMQLLIQFQDHLSSSCKEALGCASTIMFSRDVGFFHS
jgi:hypothetical protein